MSSGISNDVRARVRARAGDRCGYCRSPQHLVLGPLEIDNHTRERQDARLVKTPKTSAREVNLNLVWDYPVRWSKYKILRDLVQNFYDAVGPVDWYRRFRFRIDGDALHLCADQTGFSYEWLLHIGASTKREQPGDFAGHFGEGFKIAALCSARDFHWNIEIASREWDLRVVSGETRIDGKSIRTLAYRVWEGLPARTDTELCLWPFASSDEPILQKSFADARSGLRVSDRNRAALCSRRWEVPPGRAQVATWALRPDFKDWKTRSCRRR